MRDIVFNVSGGRKWTPKHIGLGCVLHQQIISNKLVNCFTNTGHIISYDQILQVDIALSESTLRTKNLANSAVTPLNLQQGTSSIVSQCTSIFSALLCLQTSSYSWVTFYLFFSEVGGRICTPATAKPCIPQNIPEA